MTTVSRLSLTSSIMARQFVLNSPAGMRFIAESFNELQLWSLYHGHIRGVTLGGLDSNGVLASRRFCERRDDAFGIVFATEMAARNKVPKICLDTYMLDEVYNGSGIIRNHCGAKPPRDIEPAGLVTTIRWRDRASAWYVAADRVKAPAGAARCRFRGIHGG